MKLLKNLFALIVIVSLASCSSDDDNNQFLLTNANLAGTYDVTFLNTTEVQTTDVNGADIITITTTIGETFELEIVFSENGNYLIDGLYVERYKRIVDGDIIEEDTDIIDIDVEEGTYSTNDTSMKLTLDGEVYDVTLFNENEIRITFEDVWVEDGDDFVYTEEIRLERQ